MNTFEIITKTSEDTFSLAERLGHMLHPGDVILLEGDLGAGKTTFTKGIAKGLHIRKNVNSPTFTIIKEYNGRLPLYHMDVYRVQDGFEDLGFDEYFYNDGVTVIEWAHLIEEQLPEEHLSIHLFHEGNEMRRISFLPTGDRYEALCKEFIDEYISD